MKIEEFKILSDKVSSGKASLEEKLKLIADLSEVVKGMRQDIAALKKNKELKEVRNKISKS